MPIDPKFDPRTDTYVKKIHQELNEQIVKLRKNAILTAEASINSDEQLLNMTKTMEDMLRILFKGSLRLLDVDSLCNLCIEARLHRLMYIMSTLKDRHESMSALMLSAALNVHSQDQGNVPKA